MCHSPTTGIGIAMFSAPKRIVTNRASMSSPPSPSLVLIVYEMPPTDSSQPSIFTPLSFSAHSHCA